MKLLYLSILSFVFVTSTALLLTKNSVPLRSRIVTNEKAFTPVPVLASDSSFPIISAQAALAVDLNSGVSLYEKNPDKSLLPASTTKIVTALTAMDYYPRDTVLTVGKVGIDGQKMGLVTGEKIKVSDLLYGLLVYSANDAAKVLAQNYCAGTCGEAAFVQAMNVKALHLSLKNTKFSNPAGLDDGDGHMTTARDLVRVSSVAMQIPEFAKIVGTKSIVVKSTDGKIVHRLTNINELLGKVAGVEGVKTGWTEGARENLVTYINRDNHKVMIAILGSQDRFGETRELIDWIFGNYSWQPVGFSVAKVVNY